MGSLAPVDAMELAARYTIREHGMSKTLSTIVWTLLCVLLSSCQPPLPEETPEVNRLLTILERIVGDTSREMLAEENRRWLRYRTMHCDYMADTAVTVSKTNGNPRTRIEYIKACHAALGRQRLGRLSHLYLVLNSSIAANETGLFSLSDNPYFPATITKEDVQRKDRVTSLRFLRKKGILIVGFESGYMSFYDAKHGGWIRSIRAHKARADRLVTTHNDNILVTGSTIGDEVKIWGVDSGDLIRVYDFSREAFTITPDGLLYVFPGSGKINYLDVLRDEIGEVSKSYSSVITAAASTTDSGLIALGDASGSLSLWAVDRDKNGVQLRDAGRLRSGGRSDEWTIELAFSRDGRTLYAIKRSGIVDVWDVGEQRLIKTIKTSVRHTLSSILVPDSKFAFVMGSPAPSGTGEKGVVERVNLESGDTRIMTHTNAWSPRAAVLFPDDDTAMLMIADQGYFRKKMSVLHSGQ